MGRKGGNGPPIGAGAAGSIQDIFITPKTEGRYRMGEIVFFGKIHGSGLKILRLESEGSSDFV